MPTTRLLRIRDQLERREIDLSDALLLTSRGLRTHVPDDRLMWLNRELLGYNNDDLDELFSKDRLIESNTTLFERQTESGTADLPLPDYRFLNGTWGLTDAGGMVVSMPAENQKFVFCNIGIQQVESVLAELPEPEEGLFSMSYDSNTGAQFYCSSTELIRLLERVSERLIRFIDDICQELRQEAQPPSANESEQA